MSNQTIALKSNYVFHSASSKTTYVLNMLTKPSASITVFGVPNPCQGYEITSGTLTVVKIDGTSTNYIIPPGKTTFIYNAIWASAAQSPDGSEASFCSGIDQLCVLFSDTSSNTSIFANSSNSITINDGTSDTDTATLLVCTFPPEA